MSDRSGDVRNLGVDRRREADFAERVGREMKSAADLLARFGRTATKSAPRAAAIAKAWDVEGLTAQITASATKLLGGRTVEPDSDFFELGATSVNAVEFIAMLSQELGVTVTLDDLFADARPRRLAERWVSKAGAAPADANVPLARAEVPEPDLEQVKDDVRAIEEDLALANTLPWVSACPLEAPRRILLTGATGFLGSQMLFDLLRYSDAHVLCLVRGADDAQATERLAKELEARDLPWSTELQRRITVVAGDIQEKRLGWDAARWDAIANDVDCIVNVAAAVDFLRGYRSLRRANVLGVLTLAELAMTGRAKSFHQISTISVFDEIGIRSMGEDDPPAHIDRLFAGYEKTKWTAEAILRRARERGLLVSFYRPGGIGGHTITGVYNPLDLSSGFMAAWQAMRAMPEFRHLHVAPVDWVSRIASELVLDPTTWGHNYNLAGAPLKLRQVARDMSLGGMNVRVMSFEAWRQQFLAQMESTPMPQLEFLARVLVSPTALKLIEATLTAPAATAERTDAFIRRRKLPKPPAFDVRAMIAMSERLARDGRSKLPDRNDPRFIQFTETMQGKIGPVGGAIDMPWTSKLKLSVASFYQLLKDRRIDIHGEVTCEALSPEPLVVESGDCWMRPDDGVPERHGHEHPLLRYALVLRATDGQRYWVAGTKTARPGRDFWRQGRTLQIDVGREGEPARFEGVLVVPASSYVPDQIDGILVNPASPSQERGIARLLWLAWFGAQFSLGFSEPMLRAFVELLDARRGFALKEQR